jgi:hypothetical protein
MMQWKIVDAVDGHQGQGCTGSCGSLWPVDLNILQVIVTATAPGVAVLQFDISYHLLLQGPVL